MITLQNNEAYTLSTDNKSVWIDCSQNDKSKFLLAELKRRAGDYQLIAGAEYRRSWNVMLKGLIKHGYESDHFFLLCNQQYGPKDTYFVCFVDMDEFTRWQFENHRPLKPVDGFAIEIPWLSLVWLIVCADRCFIDRTEPPPLDDNEFISASQRKRSRVKAQRLLERPIPRMYKFHFSLLHEIAHTKLHGPRDCCICMPREEREADIWALEQLGKFWAAKISLLRER